MPETSQAVRGAGWIGGLTKAVIYPVPKGGSPCLSGTGFKWHKVETYPVNWQTTQVRLTKGTQDNPGHMWLNK